MFQTTNQVYIEMSNDLHCGLWEKQGGHNSGRVPLPAAKQLDVHGIRIPPLKDLRHERAAGEPWTSQWTSLGVNIC